MFVRLTDIPEKGRKIQELKPASWLGEMISFEDISEFEVTSDIEIDLFIKKVKTQADVTGWIRMDISFPCVQCGETSSFRLETRIDEHFLPAETYEPKEKKQYDLTEDDFELAFYYGNEIELGRYLAESVLLSLDSYLRCPACTKQAYEDDVEEKIRYEEEWELEEDEIKPDANPMWQAELLDAKEALGFNDEGGEEH